MTDIAVNDDRLAVDHVDRESLTHFPLVHVSQYDVEHQGFSRQRCFAAERNPLVALAPLDNHVREYPEHAVSRFRQPVSLVSSSIRHAQDRATAMPKSAARQSVQFLVVSCEGGRRREAKIWSWPVGLDGGKQMSGQGTLT